MENIKESRVKELEFYHKGFASNTKTIDDKLRSYVNGFVDISLEI